MVFFGYNRRIPSLQKFMGRLAIVITHTLNLLACVGLVWILAGDRHMLWVSEKNTVHITVPQSHP